MSERVENVPHLDRKACVARVVATVATLLMVLHRGAAAQECPPPTGPERITQGIGGAPPDGLSESPSVSDHGCLVAFRSEATNLIPNDVNGQADLFVVDRVTMTTTRIPTAFAANPPYPNGESFAPTLSTDGRLVAFGSVATNFVCGDANHSPDLFLVDWQGATSGAQTVAATLALSAGPGTPGACEEFEGGGGVDIPSLPPGLSRDARYATFTSISDALLPDRARDQNGTYDVFVYDRETGGRELVSLTTTGSLPGRSGNGPSKGGAVSADGCRIAFFSDANNLVPGDKNTYRDVFLRDRCNATTTLVSVASDGTQGNGPSPVDESPPSVSGDGRRIVFSSRASSLVPGDANGVSDVFVRDLDTSTTFLVSQGLDGTSGNGASTAGQISADGRYIVFQSSASNLVPDDSNAFSDVFVRNMQTGAVQRVSVGASGEQGGADSYGPAMSADGRMIVFLAETGSFPSPGVGESVYAAPNPQWEPEPTPTPTGPHCPGDCDGDERVTIDELLTGVNIALGTAPPDACPSLDTDGDRAVSIDELIVAVNTALLGCPR